MSYTQDNTEHERDRMARKTRIGTVKQVDQTGLEYADDRDVGLWEQEVNAWIQAHTLKSLFTSEDWVFITVDLIAREISSLPRRVMRKLKQPDGTYQLEPAPEHPLQSLLDAPNPMQGPVTFRYLETLEHVLMGNIVIWYGRLVKQMMILPTEAVQIYFDTNGKPSYCYNPVEPNAKESNLVFQATDIMHVLRPNPSSMFWGLSPFVPGRKCLLFNRYSQDYLNAFYLKGATPQMVLEIDKDANADSSLRMLKSFETAYTGRRNQRRTMLLPKGVSAKTVGATIADQQLIDVVRMNRETILNILHVPKHAVGLAESGSLGSREYVTALKYFWQSTIIPTDKAINDEYCRFFKWQLGDSFTIESDYSNVPILQEDEKEKAELGNIQLNHHTINEVRSKLYKLEPVQGGDVILPLAKLASVAMRPLFGGSPGSVPSVEPTQSEPARLPESTPNPEPIEDIDVEFQEDMPQGMTLGAIYHGVDFTPPHSVRERTKQGLKWLDERQVSRRLGDRVRKRAEGLASGKAVTPNLLRRIDAWFAKHGDVMFNCEEDGSPSLGKVCSLLIGHREGRKWARRVLKQVKSVDSTLGRKPAAVVLGDVQGIDEGEHPGDRYVKDLTGRYKLAEIVEEATKAEEAAMPVMMDLVVKTLSKMFEVIIREVVKDLRANVKAYELPPMDDEANGVPSRVQTAKLRRRLERLVQALMKEWNVEYAKALNEVMELGYNQQLSMEFMSENRGQLEALRDRNEEGRLRTLESRGIETFKNVSATRTDAIIRLIEHDIEIGRTVRQIASDIADDFKEVTIGRANTIARTEVLTASSLGQAAIMADALTVMPGLMKTWINAADIRVRGNPQGLYKDAEFDHWELQGETVEAEEPFSNGLQFPREPGGEPGNVINCRCTMLLLPPEEAGRIPKPKE
jgi:HK97 family phage portal protein